MTALDPVLMEEAFTARVNFDGMASPL